MDLSTRMPRGMLFPATDTSLAGIYIRACRFGPVCAALTKIGPDPLFASRNLPPFLDVCTRPQSQSGLLHASLRSYLPLRGPGGGSRGVARLRAGRPVPMGGQPWRQFWACDRPGEGAGTFCYARLGRGRRIRLADSQHKFLFAEKNGGRAVERTPAWVEGAFADSPKT